MELFQVIWTRFAVKPVPWMVTEVPAGPAEGEVDSDGADAGAAAKVVVKGSRSAPMTTIIVAVAAQSRQRELRGAGGGVSETHRVPFQKVNAVLRSATRLTL
jgi:hypothetical protein